MKFYTFKAIIMLLQMQTTILTFRYHNGELNKTECDILRKNVVKINRWSHELIHELDKDKRQSTNG